MKIKVLNKKYLDDKTINLLWTLEQNSKFEERLKKIRKELKINVQKDRKKRKFTITSEKEIKKLTDLVEEANKLLEKFKLPKTWHSAFVEFIVTDKLDLSVVNEIALEVDGFAEKGSIKFMIGPNLISSVSSNTVKIVIGSKVTKTHLINWIEKNWKTIKQGIEHLNLSKAENIRWQRLDLVKEIIRKKEKGKSYGEICAELSEKFNLKDETYVRTIHSRYKKRLEKIF